MKYRIVQNIEGHFCVTEVNDIDAWAKTNDIKIERVNFNSRQRAELQGQPKLPSFYGPMWDGDAIRYEDQRSYDILST